jgi:hypothetical protein
MEDIGGDYDQFRDEKQLSIIYLFSYFFVERKRQMGTSGQPNRPIKERYN